jgi:hypothetical protein
MAARKIVVSPTSSQLCAFLDKDGSYCDSLDFFWQNDMVAAVDEYETICNIMDTSFTGTYNFTLNNLFIRRPTVLGICLTKEFVGLCSFLVT